MFLNLVCETQCVPCLSGSYQEQEDCSSAQWHAFSLAQGDNVTAQGDNVTAQEICWVLIGQIFRSCQEEIGL